MGKQRFASRSVSDRHVMNGNESMKLTASNVRTATAPEGKSDHIEWDSALPGFGLRLRGANKSYVIQYRFGKQQRRESLGDVRRVTLDAARDIARKRFAQIELGVDPDAEKAEAREEAATAALTLSAVADRYLDARRNTLRANSVKAAERNFRVHWQPLSNRPIGEIKRAEIASQLQMIVKEYGRAAAARARSTLSSLFSWSMREGLCEANPVIGTTDPGRELQSRDRVLGDAELAAVWRAVHDDDFGRIVRLLILTGTRRAEISGLRWDEITGNTITISAARSKNRKMHTLVLPPMASQILESVPRRGDHVFGKYGKGFARWAFHADKLRARLGQMNPWTLHDLRRSAATGMAEIGIAPHIIDAVLNHVSGHKAGVAGIYNRAAYAEPMRLALQRWADHVARIVEGRASNVTPLRRA
jgi:integrase